MSGNGKSRPLCIQVHARDNVAIVANEAGSRGSASSRPTPARFTGGAYQLGADIALGEVFLVHKVLVISLLPQQGLDISAAPEHLKNQHVVLFDAVDDDILAHGKTPQARAQILIAVASDVRVSGKKIETLGDGINEPVGNLDAAAFFGDVIPDVIEFGFGFRCNTVSQAPS